MSWWSCGVDDVDAIVRVDDEPRATSSAGGRVEAVDAGRKSDAGSSTIAFDAGWLDFDAGMEADAGTPVIAFDAGTESDAGAPVSAFDAGGRLDVDAGPPVSVSDAGLVSPTGAGAALSAHTALGLPDTSAVGALDRWLLVKPQFVLSYDTLRKTPRWVSWRLDTSWLGTATRASSFRRDAQLPTTAGQARDEDFRNSGFERGHLCPSADRTNTDPDNDATFVFTNVVPQTRASNGGTWATLEDEARAQARLGKTVFLVAGPVFGVTSQFIGAGVPVPTATFKIAVIVDGPVGLVPPVTTSTRVIAVLVPNTTSVSGSWRSFRVSVRSIEQATGFDFLADVPRAVQDVVETRVDAEP
ncbi:MAG: DNA/RNA non-specific endonuclease [Myxococcales bacterium]|nr:DNA/RNA non-specific endonuclease [Myxococcales bacterium]